MVHQNDVQSNGDGAEIRNTVDISDPGVDVVGMDFIYQNMNAETECETFRKWFQDDQNAMLARIASHVAAGLYSIVSLQLSKHGCVLVCVAHRELKDFPEDSWIG